MKLLVRLLEIVGHSLIFQFDQVLSPWLSHIIINYCSLNDFGIATMHGVLGSLGTSQPNCFVVQIDLNFFIFTFFNPGRLRH